MQHGAQPQKKNDPLGILVSQRMMVFHMTWYKTSSPRHSLELQWFYRREAVNPDHGNHNSFTWLPRQRSNVLKITGNFPAWVSDVLKRGVSLTQIIYSMIEHWTCWSSGIYHRWGKLMRIDYSYTMDNMAVNATVVRKRYGGLIKDTCYVWRQNSKICNFWTFWLAIQVINHLVQGSGTVSKGNV